MSLIERDGDVRLTHISTGHNHRLSRSEQFVSKLEFLPMSSSVFIATGQAGLVRMYDLRERSRTSVIVDLSSIGGSTTLSFAPGVWRLVEGVKLATSCAH